MAVDECDTMGYSDQNYDDSEDDHYWEHLERYATYTEPNEQ